MTLRIFLLGQFRVLAGSTALKLPSRPAQSLLAYLVVHAGETHRREQIAGMLWPDATETNARRYLRQALWRIRKSLGTGKLAWEEYLQINDIDVTFDARSDYWLDAALLLADAKTLAVDEHVEVVSLYRGELLPGFYDAWVALERDRLQAAYQQKMNLLLERLIENGRWEDALKWAEEWIRLGYAVEPAYRALMCAHAGLGDLGMVGATYRRCEAALERELDLEPSPETRQLYDQICRGKYVPPPAPPVSLPSLAGEKHFLPEAMQRPPPESGTFVARELELAQLDVFLQAALGGEGQIALVKGEAGAGKTALVQAFMRRTQKAHHDLIAAIGNCNAHTGIGDPYLPFREMLELLTGDVKSQWAAGAITGEHARRLWQTLPVAAEILVMAGPGLIDTFVPGLSLLERARACSSVSTAWLTRLEKLVHPGRPGPSVSNPRQTALFEEFTRVLQGIARTAPLLLVLDDLQWADPGSVSLLFHLGRHLSGSRILIVGTYRPEEVMRDMSGVRHPLQHVINEFQRQLGKVVVDVDQAEHRAFVEALLDSEPNRLGNQFREMLFQQTRGHPLFTVELLRGMQERGDLVKTAGGYWEQGPALDWETLPARVEAVIAERIDRLPTALRSALRVACVEGERFTAEVVAQEQETGRQQMLARLSSELDRRHRLIRAQSIVRVGGQLLSRYRFRHILFQKYLYGNLDAVERAYLHERVGGALEELYGQEAVMEIAVQLARHFQEARLPEKAVHFLHLAGVRAVRLSAYQDGISHLTRGLELLMGLPESPGRAQQELAVQLALGMAWVGPTGYSEPVRIAHTRARELCKQLGDRTQLCRVEGELAVFHYVHGDCYLARALAEEALTLAEQLEDPLLLAVSHWHLGFIRFSMGEYSEARAHLGHIISFYDPRRHHHSLVFSRGVDAGISALAYDACCLWSLGYPEQAAARSSEALTLAREMHHPFSLADVLTYAGCMLGSMRQDVGALRESARELVELTENNDLAGWFQSGICYLGETMVLSGQVEEGIDQMKRAAAANKAIGVGCYLPGTLLMLADAHGKGGRPEEGMAAIAEALALIEEKGERHWEAELYRVRGDLLLLLGQETLAESSLQQALDVARCQQARSWELRAAITLTRHWQRQARFAEARRLLAPIYEWFMEGFDTPDMEEARTLLAANP